VLALFGRMTTHVIRLSLAGVSVVLLRDMVYVARRALDPIAHLTARRPSRRTSIWCILIGLLLAMQLVQALVVGSMGDDDGYHLSAPKRWLEAGTLAYLPTYTNTNASMGFEMLYAIGLSVCDAIGAKLLHYSAGLFSLLSLFLSARRFSSTAVGMVAVSLMLIPNAVWNALVLFKLAYVDFGACWMAVVCIVIWLVWRKSKSQQLLVCLGLCAGFAASFKVTALAVALACVPLLVMETDMRIRDWKQSTARVAGFATVAVAPMIPWLLRNWKQTGNPVYPMFSSLIATRDWSKEQAAVFARYMRYYSWGIHAGAGLGESQRRIIVVATVVLLLVGSLAAVRIRHPILRPLTVGAGLFVAASTVSTGLLFRYWLPGVMWGSLFAASILVDSTRRSLQATIAPLVITIPFIMILRYNIQNRSQARDLLANLRIATGLSDSISEYPSDPQAEVNRYINTNTSRDARILIASFYTTFGASSYGGFWIERTCYTTDAHLQTFIRFDEWPSFLESIKNAGVTHVVISDKLFSPGRRGFDFQAGDHEYPFCRRLVDQTGELLAQFDHLQVYRIR
jgi:hypothetical protein